MAKQSSKPSIPKSSGYAGSFGGGSERVNPNPSPSPKTNLAASSDPTDLQEKIGPPRWRPNRNRFVRTNYRMLFTWTITWEPGDPKMPLRA
jgi:hypothetical protein